MAGGMCAFILPDVSALRRTPRLERALKHNSEQLVVVLPRRHASISSDCAPAHDHHLPQQLFLIRPGDIGLSSPAAARSSLDVITVSASNPTPQKQRVSQDHEIRKSARSVTKRLLSKSERSSPLSATPVRQTALWPPPRTTWKLQMEDDIP